MMSWLASLLVAAVTGVVGALVSGFVTDLSNGWYQEPTREGGAGYIVLSMGILGFFGGLVVGLVVSRLVAGSASPGVGKALGISVGVVLASGVAIAVTSRSLADVPPDLDGEPLWLLLEVRFPAAHPSPVEERREIRLTLGSVGRFSKVVRVRREGVLWLDGARRDGETWVVPGAVEIFTSRGRRFLEVEVDGKPLVAFLATVPGHPGPKEKEWSGWLSASGLTYRYCVRKKSEPIRRETYGPFQIETVVHDLSSIEPRNGLAMGAGSTFRLSHGGKPVEIPRAPGERVESRPPGVLAVMAVAASKPALLVRTAGEEDRGGLYLVTEESGEARSLLLCETGNRLEVSELVSGRGRSEAPRKLVQVSGWFDRASLDHAGLYLLDGGLFVDGRAVLDTGRLAAYKVPEPKELRTSWGAPLALSPDGRSYVRLVEDRGPSAGTSLLVSDFVAGRAYLLPVDRKRMHYLTSTQVDPAWFDHHFVWTRDGHGVDILSERPVFTPLPYRGEACFPSGATHGPITYYLWGAGEEMKKAIVDLLIAEMKAEPLPAGKDPRFLLLRIEGKEVCVYTSASDPAADPVVVSVSAEGGEAENGLVTAIGARIDAALATGKYDAMLSP